MNVAKNNSHPFLIFSKYITISLTMLCLCLPSTLEAGQVESSPPKEKGMAIPLTLLPIDKYGNLDWAKSVENNIISPIGSINGEEPKEGSHPKPLIIKSKRKVMTDALFSHDVHAYWLSCKNCHPSIFPKKSGGTEKFTMQAIFKGKFCGRCHNKVAFSLRECYRCHLPRNEKKRLEEIAKVESKGSIYRSKE